MPSVLRPLDHGDPAMLQIGFIHQTLPRLLQHGIGMMSMDVPATQFSGDTLADPGTIYPDALYSIHG